MSCEFSSELICVFSRKVKLDTKATHLHNRNDRMRQNTGFSMGHLPDKIVVYSCSFCGVECCVGGTIPVFHWLTNVATRPEDSNEVIGYIRTYNRIRQSCVN